MEDERFLTTREKIYILLRNTQRPLSVKDIIFALGLQTHDKHRIENHLYHIMKSSKRKGEKLVILPPVCRNCGYIFNKRSKTKNPSRCPKCGSYRIDGPWYKIEER